MERIFGLILALLTALSIPHATPTTKPSQQASQCFDVPEITNCLSAEFLLYWQNNGGLPVFGYPITAAADEYNVDSDGFYWTQWLERNRFELHPENAGTPYEVLLGLLGKERLTQLGREIEPREAGPVEGCLWFEQTGHNVCNQAGNLGFKSYWQSHGLNIAGLDSYSRSLQLFGLPLTSAKSETNANGDTVMTQWFERARLEWHPSNPDEFKVLLGLLGKEIRNSIAQPVPPIAACLATPNPVSAQVQPTRCNTQGSKFSFDVYGFKASEAANFWVTNPAGMLSGSIQSLNLGVNGALAGFSFDSAAAMIGTWQFTVQSADQSHQAVVYITVTAADSQPLPNPNACATTPAPSSARISPAKCGAAGTVFLLDLTGFQPNEAASFWITDPNNQIVGTADSLNVDVQGQIAQAAFKTQGFYPGTWQLTLQGKSSGHTAIIFLTITP